MHLISMLDLLWFFNKTHLLFFLPATCQHCVEVLSVLGHFAAFLGECENLRSHRILIELSLHFWQFWHVSSCQTYKCFPEGFMLNLIFSNTHVHDALTNIFPVCLERDFAYRYIFSKFIFFYLFSGFVERFFQAFFSNIQRLTGNVSVVISRPITRLHHSGPSGLYLQLASFIAPHYVKKLYNQTTV